MTRESLDTLDSLAAPPAASTAGVESGATDVTNGATTDPANATPATRSARAAQNIADWQSYLPADCIATMCRMGWDEST